MATTASTPIVPTTTRTLGKQEAIRHLVHGAVRCLMDGEDPFVIHMLIQSADKLLIDLSKKSGKPLAADLEKLIKPEKKDLFFAKYRATYNFFKHADHDYGKDLPVSDIMGFNIAGLFLVVQNYASQFGATTGHMTLVNLFVKATMPGLFNDQMTATQAAEYARLLEPITDTTPSDFFRAVQANTNVFAPTFDTELAEDRKESSPFYLTKFSEFHKQYAEVK